MSKTVGSPQRVVPLPVRWNREKNLEHAPEALHNLLILIARFNTYDPIELQKRSGYPLGWVASAVWVLLRVQTWTHFGHAELSTLLAAEHPDQSAIDACIGWEAEQLWEHDSRNQVDLEVEWYRHTGIPIEE